MRAELWRRGANGPAVAGRHWSRRALRGWSALTLLMAIVLGLGLALRPAQPVQGAPPAPDFALAMAWGGHGTLALRALRGHPVLLNFFESTCQACLDEMSTLRQSARAYRAQGVVVLGVATHGDTTATVRRLATVDHLDYPIVLDDAQSSVSWQYGVGGFPTTFFLDAQGHLRGQLSGPLDRQTVRDGLAQAGAIHCDGCAAVEPPALLSAEISPPGTTFGANFVYPPSARAPRFALRDQNGVVITPDRLRGKAVLLTFISALCREQCPLVGQTLSRALRQLGRAASRLAIVAISVAPEQDTPRATRAFAAASGWQGTQWHYLTAPRPVLQRVWAAYGVYVQPLPPIFKSGQVIVHQAGLYLIDPRGHLRAYYDVPFGAPSVAAYARALLSGGA